MAGRHPKLPVILSRIFGGSGIHPAVLPLMRRMPNIFLDITAAMDYWRRAARDIGPEWVLFATGMPFADPGIYISNVQYAMDFSTDAKKMMCGGNMRRLLEGVSVI